MLKIYFNNIKNLCTRKKISRIFNSALNNKLTHHKNLENQDFEVSIRYVLEDEIKQINTEFRNVDKVTDVLSFPILDFNSEEDIKAEVAEKKASIMLGDIVICKQVAKKQAKTFKHSLKREICFLALHGFLHLLGYDHIEKEDEKVMQALAEKILNDNNIKRK